MEKRWKFGFRGGILETSNLDLGKKMEIWISGGGYSGKVMENKKKKPTLQKN